MSHITYLGQFILTMFLRVFSTTGLFLIADITYLFRIHNVIAFESLGSSSFQSLFHSQFIIESLYNMWATSAIPFTFIPCYVIDLSFTLSFIYLPLLSYVLLWALCPTNCPDRRYFLIYLRRTSCMSRSTPCIIGLIEYTGS